MASQVGNVRIALCEAANIHSCSIATPRAFHHRRNHYHSNRLARVLDHAGYIYSTIRRMCIQLRSSSTDIDLPTTTKPSIFYTQEQIEIGKRRMAEIGRKPPAPFTRKKVRSLVAVKTASVDCLAGPRLLHNMAYLHACPL